MELGIRLRSPSYTLVVGHILSGSLLLYCDLFGVGDPSSSLPYRHLHWSI